jgi:mRNA-degrading endonuclease YafQ of YafQ-DinJ toxin-antitoxin module
MIVYYSPLFARQYKKLPQAIKEIAVKQEVDFRRDPFHPSLRTHKLVGELQGIWSFSLDYKNRILFRFLDGKKVLFLSVGDHSIYRPKK